MSALPTSPTVAGSERPLRVLVVDDEELARMRLKSLVGECGDPRCAVVGEAANGAQAMVWLTTHECDLLLLDVHMPGRDGTQLAAELRFRSPAPAIVFVTAHAEHALKAFDLEAIDYLTKPVKRERLQMALRRVAQRLALGLPAAGAPKEDEEEGPVIVVSDRGRVIRVPVGDVLYLKAELKYVTLRTADHTHVLDDSLAELEERLGDRFLVPMPATVVWSSSAAPTCRCGSTASRFAASPATPGSKSSAMMSGPRWPMRVLSAAVGTRSSMPSQVPTAVHTAPPSTARTLTRLRGGHGSASLAWTYQRPSIRRWDRTVSGSGGTVGIRGIRPAGSAAAIRVRICLP